jgi:hypothetical protein
MPAQHEFRRERSAPREACRAGSQEVTVKRFFPVVLTLCVLAWSLMAVAIHAEENISLASPSLATLSLNLAVISSSSLNAREHTVRLKFDSRFSSSLKELAAERELNSALPESLLRRPLVWRSEGPRVKLSPGFGEFFRGETVGPLRANGAGVEDSRYLYVKFSFRF